MKTKLVLIAIDGTEFEDYNKCRDYEDDYLQEYAEIKLDEDLYITSNKWEALYLSFHNDLYIFNSEINHYEKLVDKGTRIKNRINKLNQIYKETEEELDILNKDKERLDTVIDAFNNYLS